MLILLKIRQRLLYLALAPFIRLNQLLGRYRPVIWLVGEGRSGTTWVASLVNADGAWREMFEPLHPARNSAFADLPFLPYRRPSQEDPSLQARLDRVFSGRMTGFRIDLTNQRLFYRGLVVKDVCATMLARWAVRRFPDVRPVLLVRNPFAVAISKLDRKRRRGYLWAESMTVLTGQPELMADHLEPFRDLLERIEAQDDFILRQIAFWAAVHYVVFRQFEPGQIHVLFYEDVEADPREALGPLLDFIGLGHAAALPDEGRIAAPSIVSGAGDIARRRRTGSDAWRRGLTDEQVSAGRSVLDAFGLGGLYGADGKPDRAQLARFPIGGALSETGSIGVE